MCSDAKGIREEVDGRYFLCCENVNALVMKLLVMIVTISRISCRTVHYLISCIGLLING